MVGNSEDTPQADSNNANGPAATPASPNPAANANKAAEIKARTGSPEKQSRISFNENLDVAQREYRLRAASFYGDAGDRLRNSAAWDKEDAELQAENRRPAKSRS